MNTAAIQPNFDLIAKPYRWLEYLTLGSALQRCRTHFIQDISNQKEALILGDGDGRFLAQLLATNPALRAEAVDTSRTMLNLLEARCANAGSNASNRLQTHHTSALSFSPAHTCDLVVTHFFLDCLTQSQLDSLIGRLTPHLRPNAIWLISDFRVPTGLMRLPGWLFIRILYLAFRLLTGLRTTRLPDYATPLTRAGLLLTVQHSSLFGLLTTELWQLPDSPTDPTFIAMTPTDPTRKEYSNEPDTPPPPDPIPGPEPAAPTLDQPDPGVFHHDPKPPA